MQPGGAGKAIVPAGLRLNDSNLVLEAVRLGAGVALERRSLVAGAIARGELVQLTAVTVPYPWHYWLTVSRRRRTGRKSPGSSPGWRRRSPSGASRSALSLRRRRQARPGGVLLGETPEIVPGGILIEAQGKLSGHRGNVLKYRRLGVFVVFPQR
ncbi:glycine cleavage system transcriptional activator [Klebsiella pneumoniae]|uniref:Glycine cleavage system transcriptional activator n=1 Tax=Klebsiella pneumoniae TaxID=573 RepID=A0A377TSG1_KLEPN|nr:glycine cleavage system transcriptional activator [Klebsiella pneumoniae]